MKRMKKIQITREAFKDAYRIGRVALRAARKVLSPAAPEGWPVVQEKITRLLPKTTLHHIAGQCFLDRIMDGRHHNRGYLEWEDYGDRRATVEEVRIEVARRKAVNANLAFDNRWA